VVKKQKDKIDDGVLVMSQDRSQWLVEASVSRFVGDGLR